MRIVALLSWYDEYPNWLAQCVRSVAQFCEHVVAVDGPYEQFPGAYEKPRSSSDQVEAIQEAAIDSGIGCTLHLPQRPWLGGEVTKRDFMFRVAETIGADWFFRVDADEVVTHVPDDLYGRLARTERHVAETTLDQPASPTIPSFLRCFFRAIPGIRVVQAHSLVTAIVDDQRVVLAADPGAIWNQLQMKCEPAEAIHDLHMEHRNFQRPMERQRRKDAYYSLLPELEKLTPLQ